MRADAWAAPRAEGARAERAVDTATAIAADPTDITVRRGNVAVGTFRVRIVNAHTQPHVAQTDGAMARQADVVILAPAGTPLKAGDRCKTTVAGEWYVVTFVRPGQEWRLEAEAVVES